MVVENQLKLVQTREDPLLQSLKGCHQVPSLGKMFDFYLKKHCKYNAITKENLELIHWHLANIEFSSANVLDQLSLYHWDQDDPFGFGEFFFFNKYIIYNIYIYIIYMYNKHV